MGKNKILVKLFLVVFMASFIMPILNSTNAFASANALVIENAEIIEYSSTAGGYIESFDGGAINGNIIFHQLNDYVKYNITIKNVTDVEQTIESITDNNTSKYITFSYDTHDKYEVAAGESFDLLVTTTYAKLIEDVAKRAQTPGVKLIINYSDEFDILVPNTGTTTAELNATNDYLPTIILLVAAASTCVILFAKKHKQTAKIIIVLTLVYSTISIVSIARAKMTNELNISFSNTVFNLNDQIRVTYYNTNGVAHDIYVDYNADSVKLPAVEKHNYDFKEWQLEGGLPLEDFGSITEDITIYPVFIPHEYNITYNLDGGEADNPIIYTVETDDFTLEAPEKSGFVFIGWTNDLISEPTINITIEKGTEGDLEFTANYRAVHGTIHFDKNGDDVTGEMPDLIVENGEIIAFPTNAYTREHYIFIGWSIDPDSTDYLFPDCYTESNAMDIDADEEITIYAIWQESIVTITASEIANELGSYSSSITSFKHYEGTPNLTGDNVVIINSNPYLPVYIIYNDDHTEAAWWSEAEKISLDEDCTRMFSHLSAITEIDLSDFDGSKIKIMDYMFDFDTKLTTLTFPNNIDEATPTSAESTFSFTNLETLDLSKLDLSQVTNFSSMFDNDHKLKTITFRTGMTAKPTDIINMFNMCENLIDLDLSWLDTSNTTKMGGAFAGLERVETFTISDNFVTNNVTDMSCTFNSVAKVILDTIVPILDTSNVTNFTNMFGGIDYPSTLDLSHLDLRKAESLALMFYNSYITYLDLSTTLLPESPVASTNMFKYSSGAKIYINENFESILADGLGATRTLVYK